MFKEVTEFKEHKFEWTQNSNKLIVALVNTNKDLNEVRKLIQDLKIEFNEEVEISKKKTQPEMKLEMEFSTSLIKSLVDSFTNQMDHVDDRMFGLKDELEELDHSTKENGKIKI